MATETANYGLTLPDVSESIGIDAINQNAQKIDRVLKEIDDKIPPQYAADTIDHINALYDIATTPTIIVDAYPAGGGEIKTSTLYDTYCFVVAGGSTISQLSAAEQIVYAFYTERPEMGSISYNANRVVASTGDVKNIAVPGGVHWIAVRAAKGDRVQISRVSFL